MSPAECFRGWKMATAMDFPITQICLIWFLLAPALCAQVAATSPPPPPFGLSSTANDFLQEQASLVQEQQSLLDQGATDQQMEKWRRANSSRLQAQEKRMQALSAESAMQPEPAVGAITLSPASSAAGALLLSQASLARAHAAAYNQELKKLPAGSTASDVSLMRERVEQSFQLQHASELQSLVQRAKSLGAASSGQSLKQDWLPADPPAGIPRNLRAYIVARNALASSLVRMHNELVGVDVATQRAAMKQWQQQNAAPLAELKQLGQAITTLPATREETSP